MKKTTMLFLVTCVLASCVSTKHATVTKESEEDKVTVNKPATQYSNNTLIVYFDTSIGNKPILTAAKKYGSEILYQYNIVNAVALTIPPNTNINEAIAYYQNVKGVLQVNRDKVYSTE